MKQFVAYAMIACLALAIIVGVVEPASADSWYGVAGIGFFVFGIWASVILLRDK